VSGSSDNTIRLWDIEFGTCLRFESLIYSSHCALFNKFLLNFCFLTAEYSKGTKSWFGVLDSTLKEL
jgi:WD40 repeat protein